MSTVKVSAKWAGKKFDDIELDLSQPGIVFKTQLYTLTGVEPDRQKILIKGGTLKDDTDWATVGVKGGQSFMMMGTAGPGLKPPEKPVQFVEDMTSAQAARAMDIHAGLTNLGNTCYMNATLQCMRAMPELSLALQKANRNFGSHPRQNLVPALNSLLGDLKASGSSVTPMVFLQVLRSAYPQFAQQNNHGFMQQDAEECWGEIMSSLADNVPSISSSGDLIPDKKFVDQYVTGELLSTITCDDAPTEPASTELDTFRQLKINIGAGVSTYMATDLQNGLTEKIEKNSPTLGRSATYTKVSKFSRLPTYFSASFVRFQWKPTERVKAKILKRVKFPFELDLSPMCTLDLQETLRPAKMRLKEVEEKKAAEKKQRKSADPNAMEVEPEKKPARPRDELLREIGVSESLINDVGANVSGQYDLVAVLTHVGRATDSGHYIGWAKNEKGEWWKYDDDTVSLVNEEEITKLEGGGDWHTAYIVLYRTKTIE